MVETPRKWRLTTIGGVFIAGTACAIAFSCFRPFDSYLLESWESELSTIADEDVEVRLEQIAGLGERSLPTLVAALQSERQIVAQTAAVVLHRKLAELELRPREESSRIVAGLASELAAHSNDLGPHSGHASNRLATRFLLWPIDRKAVDGERLVADCELIIRTAKLSPRGLVAEQTDERIDVQDGFVSGENALSPAEILTPTAVSSLPVELTEAPPPLPPQATRGLSVPPAALTTEPQDFMPVQTPRALDAIPRLTSDKATTRQLEQPRDDIDARQSLSPRGNTAPIPREPTAPSNFREMADLDVMRKLASNDDSLTRQAVDELYRRGFKTKHFRLAELLVDPDPNVRLRLIQSLPQISGIDSRPWLLWLSRDQDPAVRKAAVTVIATSADPALQKRVSELEREETDDEVLRVVRRILDARQANTIR